MMIDVPEAPYLDRRTLYMYLGLLSAMEPMTDTLMRERNERSYVEDEHDSPHSAPWFTSHHASSFPGDESEACTRKLIYRMMNVPSPRGSVEPWVTSTGVIGKAGELDIADAWYQSGRLLAIPEDPRYPDRHQVGFRDPKHWLTGSVDLPILSPGWMRPHIVELKGKPDDVLVEMIEGRQILRDGVIVIEPRGPDEAHVRQLKASLGLAYEHDWGEVVVCRYSWRILWAEIIQRLDPVSNGVVLGDPLDATCPEHGDDCQHIFKLDPPTTGEIYYWSRSWPRGHPRLGQRTKSFFFEYDPEYMVRGREVLKQAKQNFIDGTLPPRGDKMQWSCGPCQYCDYKSVCRVDEGLEPRKRKPTLPKRTMLADSSAVEYAKSVRLSYDLESIRERVFAEWREENHESTTIA